MKINNVKINPIKNEGNVRAYVSFVMDDCFAVHRVRIIDTNGKLFVAMPSKKNNNRFIDICHPITREFRELVDKTIIENYMNQFYEGDIDGKEEI